MYECIALVAHRLEGIETQWDSAKLEKKIKEYFNKAGKNMVFKGKKLAAAIDEYVDNAMGSVFAGLGDREWLNTEEGDMTLILDAGIKDLFPGSLFKNVSQDDFEALVMASYDRAFDQQRFWPIMSEAVAAHVSGPKIKKKVWSAVDQARKDAVAANLTAPEEYVMQWVTQSIGILAMTCQNGLEAAISAEDMVKLFGALLEAGGLPTSVILAEGEAVPLHTVEEAVATAYLEHAPPAAEDLGEAPPAKRAKGVFDAFGAS